MAEVMTHPVECPKCGKELAGLGKYCWDCGDYVLDLLMADLPVDRVRTPITDSRTEREVRHAIVDLLRSLDYHVTDTEQERPTRVTEGLPDLFVMGHGRHAFVELKRPNRRWEKGQGLSAHQREWHKTARENGVPCLVWFDETDAIHWHKEGE